MVRHTENIAHSFERISAVLGDENEPIGSDSDFSEESDEEDSDYVDSATETVRIVKKKVEKTTDATY